MIKSRIKKITKIIIITTILIILAPRDEAFTFKYQAKGESNLPVRKASKAIVEIPKVEVKKSPKLARSNVPTSEVERIIKEVAVKYGLNYGMMVKIARCESSLRPNAFNWKNKNGSWDAGLFQINSIHKHSKEQLFNPRFNAEIAGKIMKAQGYTPWNSSKKCWNN